MAKWSKMIWWGAVRKETGSLLRIMVSFFPGVKENINKISTAYWDLLVSQRNVSVVTKKENCTSQIWFHHHQNSLIDSLVISLMIHAVLPKSVQKSHIETIVRVWEYRSPQSIKSHISYYNLLSKVPSRPQHSANMRLQVRIAEWG